MLNRIRNLFHPKLFWCELEVGLIQLFFFFLCLRGGNTMIVLISSAVLLSTVFICTNGGVALVSLPELMAYSESAGVATVIHK